MDADAPDTGPAAVGDGPAVPDDERALDDAADELYALAPEHFTAGRDACAAACRVEGRRELAARVKALRRPSVAAWLVNVLVRHRADEVEALLALGASLRTAQAVMDADQLRDLGRQRQAVVAAVGRQARALARELGRPVTDPVVDAVEETLRAALADPGAADAVRSGRLIAPLSYAGFGEAALSGAVVTPGVRGRPRPLPGLPGAPSPQPSLPGGQPASAAPPVPPDPAEVRRDQARAAVESARAARARAEAAARRAGQHREATAHRAGTARERMDAARARVDELEQVLAGARVALARTEETLVPLQAEADAAAVQAREADTLAEQARREETAAQTQLKQAGG